MGQIILASASPRRKELLEQAGIRFEICPAQGEEVATKAAPAEVVMEIAAAKAREVAGRIKAYHARHEAGVTPQDILIIGADTVVAAGEQILGKPKDEKDAFRMLSMLSGSTHEVYTGVALVFLLYSKLRRQTHPFSSCGATCKESRSDSFLSASGRAEERVFCERTSVSMYDMDEGEIRRYSATGEPMDKAGAYGIQGKCAVYVRGIEGDYNNVVGLPIASLYRELKGMGIDWYEWQGEEHV